MKYSEESVLTTWLSGEVDDQSVKEILPDVDLDNLRLILSEQEKLDFKLHSSDVLWNKLKQDFTAPETPKPKKSSILWWLIGIAAFCIALLGLYLLNQKKQEVIKTNIASTITHKLLDGSIVKLAPKSEINYSPKLWDTARKVNLQGQAFFEVIAGSSFQVKTKSGIIEVLGTEFEVFELGDQLIVSCFEGKVKVETPNKKSVILQAQERVKLNNNLFSNVELIEQREAGFLNKKVRYSNISAQLLLKEVQRFYKIKIETEDIDLKETFTGIVVTDDLEKTCKYIAQTYGWEFQLSDGKVFFKK